MKVTDIYPDIDFNEFCTEINNCTERIISDFKKAYIDDNTLKCYCDDNGSLYTLYKDINKKIENKIKNTWIFFSHDALADEIILYLEALSTFSEKDNDIVLDRILHYNIKHYLQDLKYEIEMKYNNKNK